MVAAMVPAKPGIGAQIAPEAVLYSWVSAGRHPRRSTPSSHVVSAGESLSGERRSHWHPTQPASSLRGMARKVQICEERRCVPCGWPVVLKSPPPLRSAQPNPNVPRRSPQGRCAWLTRPDGLPGRISKCEHRVLCHCLVTSGRQKPVPARISWITWIDS